MIDASAVFLIAMFVFAFVAAILDLALFIARVRDDMKREEDS